MAMTMGSVVPSAVLAAPARTILVTSCLNFSYLITGEGGGTLYIVSRTHGRLSRVSPMIDPQWTMWLVTVPIGSSDLQFVASGRNVTVFISQVALIDGRCPSNGRELVFCTCIDSTISVDMALHNSWWLWNVHLVGWCKFIQQMLFYSTIYTLAKSPRK